MKKFASLASLAALALLTTTRAFAQSVRQALKPRQHTIPLWVVV